MQHITIKKDFIARFGLIAIGTVYVLIGVLTALASFNLGGARVGTKGAIGYLSNQNFSTILLFILSMGLFSYAIWRFYQTIFDSRELGNGMNALFTRAGYFTGGLFYGLLGYMSLKLCLGGSYDKQRELLLSALQTEYGSWLSVIIGLILLGKAIFEIYFISSNKFRENIKSSQMKPKEKAVLLRFGVIGHVARGLVFAIMAFLTVRTVFSFRRKEVSTLTDAFQFLNFKFGGVILGIVALGLVCYGLFMFVKAKYLYVNMN